MAQRKSSRDDRPGGNMYVLLGALILIVGMVAAAGMIIAVLSFSNGDDGPPVNINMGGGPDGPGGDGGGGRYSDGNA